MPIRTSYDHGVPSWIDLASTDLEAAEEFFAGLFGWSFEPYGADPNGEYVVALRKGQRVAGLIPMPADMRASGTPSMWTTYIAVDDVDAAAARVDAAGGTLVTPPTRVSEAGSMAIIVDPGGAMVGLWHGDEHAGAGIVNEHGALSWNELQTPDPAGVAAFYREVIGWHADTVDMGPAGDYTVFHQGDGKGVAGAMQLPTPGAPPHWSVVFGADDPDATADAARELGGAVLVEPFDIDGVGRCTVVADPTGAAFQAIRMAQRD